MVGCAIECFRTDSSKLLICRGGRAEWKPSLRRTADALTHWWAAGLCEVVEARRPDKGVLIGAIDGSQFGRKGAYGWMMIYHTSKYNTSGKDDERIKDGY